METNELIGEYNVNNMKSEELVHIWLNYDLSFNGDYDGLFKFLDKCKAVDAGLNSAYIKMKYVDNHVEVFFNDLRKSMKLTKDDRIYLTVKYKGNVQAGFMVGKPMQPNWKDYNKTAKDVFNPSLGDIL